MLFHDPSCHTEAALQENKTLGVYDLCGILWEAICTCTDRGALYIDGELTAGAMDPGVARRFLEQEVRKLCWKGEEAHRAFRFEGLCFLVLSVRRDTRYSVFTVYCTGEESMEERNLLWLKIYARQKYQSILLNNEIVQERDLTANVVDSIAAAIVVVDLSGKIVSCNGKLREVFGADECDVLGVDALSTVTHRYRSQVEEAFRCAMERGERRTLRQLFIYEEENERVVNVTVSPLRNSKEAIAGAVIVGTDVTEHYFVEHELQQKEQLGLLGQVAAGLAHDVKNPLMVIGGCTRAMLREEDLPPKQGDLLRIILHESERIDEVIGQMLSFGNAARQTQSQPLDLNDILDNCVQVVIRQNSLKRVTFDTQLDERLPLVRGDNRGLQQVFLNLLVNAVEAVPPGGRIEILSTMAAGGGVEVVVRDNGRGIPQADMQRVFRPYFSTKEEGGSGLGLYLVRRVLRQHGAEITIDSNHGKGTLVTVHFPVLN